MGAAEGAAQFAFNGLAPAPAQAGPDQPAHRRCGLEAFVQGRVIHHGEDVVHDEVVVDGHAQRHAVDPASGREDAALEHHDRVVLDVGQLGFDVPQTVFAVVATVGRGSRM